MVSGGIQVPSRIEGTSGPSNCMPILDSKDRSKNPEVVRHWVNLRSFSFVTAFSMSTLVVHSRHSVEVVPSGLTTVLVVQILVTLPVLLFLLTNAVLCHDWRLLSVLIRLFSSPATVVSLRSARAWASLVLWALLHSRWCWRADLSCFRVAFCRKMASCRVTLKASLIFRVCIRDRICLEEKFLPLR